MAEKKTQKVDSAVDKKEELDPIDQLFDENNTDNIVMYDENGNPQEFEQIAIVPVEDNVYAVLHPVNQDADDDEVWVFEITEINGEEYLVVEDDEKVVDKVFANFRKLLEKEEKEEKETKKK